MEIEELRISEPDSSESSLADLSSQSFPSETEQSTLSSTPRSPYPPNFSGLWVTKSEITVTDPVSEMVLSNYMKVKLLQNTRNSHEIPAAFRSALRNQILDHLRHRFRGVRQKIPILVLDPGPDETAWWSRHLTYVEKGKPKQGVVSVQGLREELHPGDLVRGRIVQRPRKGFKADIVIASDCLYYYDASKLSSAISPYVRSSVVVYAVLKPICLSAPGLFVEEHRYLDIRLDPPQFAVVKAGVGVCAEGNLIEYTSSYDRPDGGYINPSPDLWVSYSRLRIDEERCFEIHLDRGFPYMALYKIIFATEHCEDRRSAFAPVSKGVVFNEGVCFPILDSCIVAAGRADFAVKEQVEGYKRMVRIKVADCLGQYRQVAFAPNSDFFRQCATATAEAARFHCDMVLSHCDSDSSQLFAEEVGRKRLEDQGIPPVLSRGLAILTGRSTTRLGSSIQLCRGIAAVLSDAKEALVGNRHSPLDDAMSSSTEGEFSDSSCSLLHKVPGLPKVFRRIQQKLFSTLSAVHRNNLDSVATRAIEFLLRNPIPNLAVDVGVTLAEAFVVSLAEEALRLAVPSSLKLVYGFVFAVVEGLCEAVETKDWDLLEAAVKLFLKSLFFSLLSLLSLPLALAVHTVINFAALYRKNKVIDLLRVVLEDSLESGYERVHRADETVFFSESVRVVDALGHELGENELILLHHGTDILRKRVAKVAFISSPELVDAFLAPNNGWRSLLQVGFQRLDVCPLKPEATRETAWNVIKTFLPNLEPWSYQLLTCWEVVDYLWARPWPASHRHKRIGEYLGFVQKSGGDLFCKIDEILRTRPYEHDLLGRLLLTKTRPIFPTGSAGMPNFEFMVPFAQATFGEMAPVPIFLSEVLDWSFIYVKKANANVLTMLLNDYVPRHRITTLSLGDDVMIIINVDGILLCICSDFKSCDLHANEVFQDTALQMHAHLNRDVSFIDRIPEISAERRRAVQTTARDLESEYMGYKLRVSDPIGTKTGDAITAITAMTQTLFMQMTAIKILESELAGTPFIGSAGELGASIVGALSRSASWWGFSVEYERLKDNPVMPLEYGTFLGGTFDLIENCWIPLKCIKSFFCPTGIFGSTRLDDLVGWARVLLKDELSILPIRNLLERTVETYSWVSVDALAKWKHHLEQKKDWRLEFAEPPTFSVGWDAWERQLSHQIEKHNVGGLSPSQCLAEIESLDPANIEEWTVNHASPLFVARFGVLPQACDGE
jgi:hypothetical protein